MLVVFEIIVCLIIGVFISIACIKGFKSKTVFCQCEECPDNEEGYCKLDVIDLSRIVQVCKDYKGKPAAEEILNNIRRIITTELNTSIDPEYIEMDTSFDELGADSIDVLIVITATEADFNIKIPAGDIGKFVTVGDLVRYVELDKS